MKLWLDDVRPMPEGYQAHAKTAQEAIDILKREKVTHISFDHDLGDAEGNTGYAVACFIEELAFLREIKQVPIWRVHSANPVGAENIRKAMEKAEDYARMNFERYG